HHPDNLHALYRESQDPIERSRWHALWLLATGHPIPKVAQTLGYSTRWVRDTLHRYNQGKPMADLRHQNPGQPPLLPPELQEAFRQALLQPHPRDGIWTIRNAAEWLSERLGRPVDPRRAWSWMKRLGFAPLRPRPRHRERDLAEGEAFKKTSSSRSFS
ncbi:winged helix-turn-helix domain-containing protein, partial [Thermus scotoductus]